MAIQYDARLHRYRDQATGRLISFERVTQLVEAEVTTAERKMVRLGQRLIRDQISVSQFQREGATLLRDTSVRLGLMAAGGKAQATQQNLGTIGAELRNQYTFLHDFGVEIEDGRVSDRQLLNRAKQYGRNTRASFYKVEFQRRAQRGYLVKRLLDPQSKHCPSCIRYETLSFAPILNVVPIGVDCECRSRCRCRLVFKAG